MLVNQTLINECLKNNRKAQFELYQICYGVLMSICYRYRANKEDAEELLNQGFLKVLLNLDKYNVKVPFEAWIRRIMVNTIIDEFRKSKKEKEHLNYADFQEETYLDNRVDFNLADLNFEAEELLNMLNKLPEMSRKVFNLYAIDGYAHKEIAEMLTISVGTSKWHVSFARAELKKMINNKRIK